MEPSHARRYSAVHDYVAEALGDPSAVRGSSRPRCQHRCEARAAPTLQIGRLALSK